jgi:hypothetical protein
MIFNIILLFWLVHDGLFLDGMAHPIRGKEMIILFIAWVLSCKSTPETPS